MFASFRPISAHSPVAFPLLLCLLLTSFPVLCPLVRFEADLDAFSRFISVSLCPLDLEPSGIAPNRCAVPD